MLDRPGTSHSDRVLFSEGASRSDHCVRLHCLKQIDLSPCTGLKVFGCSLSSFTSLDVSCCPLLSVLDVSWSMRLEHLCTNNCNKLVEFRSETCLSLRHMPAGTERTGSHAYVCRLALWTHIAYSGLSSRMQRHTKKPACLTAAAQKHRQQARLLHHKPLAMGASLRLHILPAAEAEAAVALSLAAASVRAA